jgi:hypothetical protein
VYFVFAEQIQHFWNRLPYPENVGIVIRDAVAPVQDSPHEFKIQGNNENSRHGAYLSETELGPQQVTDSVDLEEV